jgi:hypothetical protein
LTALTGTPFSGHSFPPAVIGLAGLWYFRSRLGDADVVEWLAEWYIQVDPSTVFDWVQKFAPWYQDAVQNEAKHAPGALVVLVNSDVIDKLGFGTFPSIPVRPPLLGAVCLSFRVFPDPYGAAAGDPRTPSSS